MKGKTKTFLIFLLLISPLTVLGDVGEGAAITSAMQYLQGHFFFPFKPIVNVNPLLSSGSAAVSSAHVPPQVLTIDDKHRIEVFNGNEWSSVGNRLTLLGGGHVRYRGYDLYADEITVDKSTQVMSAVGNARLISQDEDVRAGKIIVDFRHRTYQGFNAVGDLSPNLVGGVLLKDIYGTGKTVTGNEQESFFTNSETTTCEYPEPHYYFSAKSTDIRYRKRIIFRNLDIFLLKKKLVHLPFLSLPIDERSYDNLPVIGQDSVEGYFIKTHYGIPLSGPDTLLTRVDYFSLLGLGLGATYTYEKDRPTNPFFGAIGVYGVSGSGTLDIQENNSAKIGADTLTIQNSIQNHDYNVAPQSNLLNSSASLSMPFKAGTTNLNFAENTNTSSGFSSSNQSFGLNDNRHYGKIRLTSRATFTSSSSSYLSNGTTTDSVRKIVDVNFNGDDDLKQVDATLSFQKSIPIGTIQNFYSGSSTTPNLTLQTDTSRLLGPKAGSSLPIQASASIGQFGDPVSGGYITRDYFNLSGSKQITGDNGRFQIGLNSRFTQGVYSDNTAEYSLAYGADAHYKLGADTSINLRYNYLQPKGFTPLGLDSIWQVNLATADISVRPTKPFLVGIQTGYDSIQLLQGQTAWQPVGIRTEYTPHSWLMLRSSATYDPFIGSWANVRLDATYKPGATFIGLGVRYDATRHVFADTNIYVQALKWGRSKIDILADYDGFAKQFISQQLSVTYDLHCAEAVFQIANNQSGFQNGLQLSFFVRLKAFPFSGGFGSGTRGQPIGIGTGIGY